jgi:hypothetical protein
MVPEILATRYKIKLNNWTYEPRDITAAVLEENFHISIAEPRPTFRDDGQDEVIRTDARVQ